MKKENTYSVSLIATLMASVLFVAPMAGAQVTHTWEGDTDASFNNGANWDTGLVPAQGDTAVFGGSVTPVTWNTSNKLGAGTFNSGGWSINATARVYMSNINYDTANLGTIEFTKGHNNSRFGLDASSGTWNIGTGNILHVSNTGNFEMNQQATKTGAGTFLLSAADTGGGSRGMDIDEGTVILNSTNTPNASNSPWSIAAGAILGGNGGIRSNETNANGIAQVFGTLQAGGSGNITDGQSNVVDAGSQFGSFSVDYTGNATRGVSMETGSNLVIQFSSDSSQNSQVDMLGGLFDIGTNVTLDLEGPGAIDPGTYTLLSFDDGLSDGFAGTYAGTFGDLQLNGSSAGSDYSLSYNTNSIDLTVIPEPGALTLALLALGGSGLMLFRRKLA